MNTNVKEHGIFANDQSNLVMVVASYVMLLSSLIVASYTIST